MNTRHFLRQQVTVERSTGETEWGDSSYSAPEILPARKELKQGRVVSASSGEVISSTTRLWMADQVALGDKVDGEQVVAVESIVDRGGKTLGYACYL